MYTAFYGGLEGTQTGAVTITDTSGTIAATILSGIGSQTSGTVTAASSGITISGSTSELTAALVTSSSKVVASNARNYK